MLLSLEVCFFVSWSRSDCDPTNKTKQHLPVTRCSGLFPCDPGAASGAVGRRQSTFREDWALHCVCPRPAGLPVTGQRSFHSAIWTESRHLHGRRSMNLCRVNDCVNLCCSSYCQDFLISLELYIIFSNELKTICCCCCFHVRGHNLNFIGAHAPTPPNSNSLEQTFRDDVLFHFEMTVLLINSPANFSEPHESCQKSKEKITYICTIIKGRTVLR